MTLFDVLQTAMLPLYFTLAYVNYGTRGQDGYL